MRTQCACVAVRHGSFWCEYDRLWLTRGQAGSLVRATPSARRKAIHRGTDCQSVLQSLNRGHTAIHWSLQFARALNSRLCPWRRYVRRVAISGSHRLRFPPELGTAEAHGVVAVPGLVAVADRSARGLRNDAPRAAPDHAAGRRRCYHRRARHNRAGRLQSCSRSACETTPRFQPPRRPRSSASRLGRFVDPLRLARWLEIVPSPSRTPNLTQRRNGAKQERPVPATITPVNNCWCPCCSILSAGRLAALACDHSGSVEPKRSRAERKKKNNAVPDSNSSNRQLACLLVDPLFLALCAWREIVPSPSLTPNLTQRRNGAKQEQPVPATITPANNCWCPCCSILSAGRLAALACDHSGSVEPNRSRAERKRKTTRSLTVTPATDS